MSLNIPPLISTIRIVKGQDNERIMRKAPLRVSLYCSLFGSFSLWGQLSSHSNNLYLPPSSSSWLWMVRASSPSTALIRLVAFVGVKPIWKQFHAMVLRKGCLMLWTMVFYFSVASAAFFVHCDARSPRHLKAYNHHQNPTNKKTSSSFKNPKTIKPLKHFNIYPALFADSVKPTLLDAESPYSMPPLDETMGPLSPSYLPENQPPFCIYPPFTPLPPSVTIPSPVTYATPPPPPSSSTTPIYPIENPPPPSSSTTPIYPIENPPPPSLFNPSPPSYPPSPPGSNPSPPEYGINPPIILPSPTGYIPSPPEYVPSPPENVPSPPEFVPGPPEFVPGPPEFGPGPPEYVPGTPVFLPPVIYPSPFAPPPSRPGTGFSLWCVAKPSVPEPIIQEAMNYACGSGADCGSVQPSGSCYEPNTLLAHASYAFNSYWQRTKSNGGTCDFGGTAILVTKDPSYDGCHFMLG